jgi:positive regulator of sigma E activity
VPRSTQGWSRPVLFATGLWLASTAGSAPGQTIACGESASGSIDVVGEVDTFTYVAPGPGRVSVSIGEIAAQDAGFSACWRMISSTAQCSWARVTIPAAGEYTIEVFDNGNNQRGSYGISLQGVSASLACGSTVSCGQDGISGPLLQAGDSDAYEFDGAAGDVVLITPSEVAVVDPGFTATMALFDPDGETVGAQFSDNAVRTLPVSGSYTVQVRESSGDDRGSYGLSLQWLSASGSCAAPIACGETATTALEQSGDTDAFRFSGSAGDVVSIGPGEVSEVDAGFEPCWTIWEPDGSGTIVKACGAGQRTLAQTGSHTLVVSDETDRRRGTASLSLEGVSQSGSCATPLACGEDGVSGALDPAGDIDTFRFDAATGDAFAITIADQGDVDPGFLSRFELFSPTGVQIGGSSTGYRAVTLSDTGTHTLHVFEAERERGSYGLSLHGISSASGCGRALACGEPALAGHLDPRGDTDAFRFLGTAGDQVTLTATDLNDFDTGFTACWRLFGPDGSVVGDNVCQSGGAARTLAATGLHTVHLADTANTRRGSYSLSVAGACQTACGNGALDAGEACDDGSPAGLDCCDAICAAVPDADADGVCDRVDNCPTVSNPPQSDTDGDGVGQICDACASLANAPVAPSAVRLWMTLLSGQRDDDGDGLGNACDFDHNQVGLVITSADFNDAKASVGKLVTGATCGVAGTATCGKFDHDEVGAAITSSDFNLDKAAVGKLVPARCGPGCTPPFDAPGKASCVGPACAAPIP